jgi:hypothetical protein
MRVELKPRGIEELLFLAFAVVLVFSVLLFMAIDYGSKWFYMSIPFVALLGIWLIIYFPYKLYIYLTRAIDTVVFDEKGIYIQNKRVDVFEYYPWTNITDLFINKEDLDKKPEEITFITVDKVQTISLKLYNTIFTSTEDLWDKINEIYSQHCDASQLELSSTT